MLLGKLSHTPCKEKVFPLCVSQHASSDFFHSRTTFDRRDTMSPCPKFIQMPVQSPLERSDQLSKSYRRKKEMKGKVTQLCIKYMYKMLGRLFSLLFAQIIIKFVFKGFLVVVLAHQAPFIILKTRKYGFKTGPEKCT